MCQAVCKLLMIEGWEEVGTNWRTIGDRTRIAHKSTLLYRNPWRPTGNQDSKSEAQVLVTGKGRVLKQVKKKGMDLRTSTVQKLVSG